MPVTPVSSQNKLTPLPNEDENYVIPIAHTPAATYVNGDGRRARGGETGTGEEAERWT